MLPSTDFPFTAWQKRDSPRITNEKNRKTMMTQDKSRRDQILQALAAMLEDPGTQKITTAALARLVGVSEAALYRHFPSKAKMFEALIIFIETTIFERLQAILSATQEDDEPVSERIRLALTLVLRFAERNPGMCRLMTGELLSGDLARLRPRMNQSFTRLETQLRQLLRQAEIEQGLRLPMTVNACVSFLTSLTEGRIVQYARTGFKQSPVAHWEDQWPVIAQGLFPH